MENVSSYKTIIVFKINKLKITNTYLFEYLYYDLV